MALNITAIDPSTTSTGLANLRHIDAEMGGLPADRVEWHTALVKSKTNGSEYWVLNSRYNDIRRRVGSQIDEWGLPDLIVMEGPSFGSSMKSAMFHQLSGFWWKMFDEIAGRAPLLIVPPTNRTIYATGNGNTGKDEVLLSASRRYPDAPITNNDDADAVVLAAMGARILSEPIDTLPKTHTRALDKLTVEGEWRPRAVSA